MITLAFGAEFRQLLRGITSLCSYEGHSSIIPNVNPIDPPETASPSHSVLFFEARRHGDREQAAA